MPPTATANSPVFADAFSHAPALKKIADVLAILTCRKPEDIADATYNCSNARELVDEGLSDDHELRLFETVYSGGRPTHFVEHPLFLVRDPAPLARKWAQLPRPSTEGAAP